jgi:hypothetical protein
MPSSGMLRRMVLVRTDISVECIASIISVTRIDELMLHERLHFKENNSKTCNGMPKYNIIVLLFWLASCLTVL